MYELLPCQLQGFKLRTQESFQKAYLLLDHIPDDPRHLITIHLCRLLVYVHLPTLQQCSCHVCIRGACRNLGERGYVPTIGFLTLILLTINTASGQHLDNLHPHPVPSRYLLEPRKTKDNLPAIVLANPLADKYGIKFTEDEAPVFFEALRTGRKAPRAAVVE